MANLRAGLVERPPVEPPSEEDEAAAWSNLIESFGEGVFIETTDPGW